MGAFQNIGAICKLRKKLDLRKKEKEKLAKKKAKEKAKLVKTKGKREKG